MELQKAKYFVPLHGYAEKLIKEKYSQSFISILICFKTDPLHKPKMVEESLAKLFQELNFHETASSDLIFDCITKIIAKQVSIKNKESTICVLLILNAS